MARDWRGCVKSRQCAWFEASRAAMRLTMTGAANRRCLSVEQAPGGDVVGRLVPAADVAIDAGAGEAVGGL